jgi:MFS family permease
MAASGLIIYSLLMAFKAHETLHKDTSRNQMKERFGGYGMIFKDKPFINFNLVFSMTMIAASMVWVLLAVYAKQNFGISERMYGFIPTTNAIMVVAIQIFVTRVTKKHPPLLMVAFGAVFYSVASLMIGFGSSFLVFWLAMVVMTIGELIMVPTATTFSANLAPADKRGRYMSIHSMTNGVASGIGPLLGGTLSDSISPHAPWFAGASIAFISVLFFMFLAGKYQKTKKLELI